MRDTILTLWLAALGVLVLPAFAPVGSVQARTPLPPDDNRMCTMIYKPVCAAQQVQCIKAPCYPVYRTYSNACMAGNNAIIHEGECLSNETGPYIASTTPEKPNPSVYHPRPKPIMRWHWFLPWTWWR